MPIDERKIREIEHSDRRRRIVRAYEYHSDAAPGQLEDKYVGRESEFKQHFSNMKFYSITRSSFAYRDQLLNEKIAGVIALDYCCGNGEIAIEMSKQGAKKVFGIDISEVAVTNATSLALRRGLGNRCQFKVMDAEKTEFESDYFDIIHEYGALHHLDLEAALKELSRIVKPSGKVICTEALRHNPFIHYYRKRTPQLRTKWEFEHVLGVHEIKSGLRYFDDMSVRFYHLAALAAVPFRKSRYFPALLSLLDRIDNVILRIPYLQRMAWVAVMVYKKPKKMFRYS